MTRFPTAAPILSLFLIASASFADEATIKRSYIDLDWGQIHLRTVHPVNASDNVPVVCFAPTPYYGNYYKLQSASRLRHSPSGTQLHDEAPCKLSG